MIQPEVVALYGHLENWWDRPFDQELVDFIVNAPFDQLEVAAADWPDPYPSVSEPGHLGALPKGELRPVFGEWNLIRVSPSLLPPSMAAIAPSLDSSLGPRLLLYVDSIIEDSDRLGAFTAFQLEMSKKEHDWARNDLRVALEWMLAVRPLVEDGAILFTHKMRGIVSPEFIELLVSGGIAATTDEESLSYRLGGNIAVAKEGSATPLALDTAEEATYR